MLDNCERDCSNYCVGCDKSFCDIKDEHYLEHDLELDDAIYLNCGDSYCHPDCLDSNTG